MAGPSFCQGSMTAGTVPTTSVNTRDFGKFSVPLKSCACRQPRRQGIVVYNGPNFADTYSVPVNPAVVPILNAYPLPNTPEWKLRSAHLFDLVESFHRNRSIFGSCGP
jgi:hypothetical protein